MENKNNDEPFQFFDEIDENIFSPNLIPKSDKKIQSNNSNNKSKEGNNVQYVSKRRIKTREKIKQKKSKNSYQNYLNTQNMTKEEKDVYYQNIRDEKSKLKNEIKNAVTSNFIIVFDFDYQLYMEEDEFKSLFLQIAMCYGLNKTNKNKINYYLTNYGNSIKEGLEKMGAKYWHCHQSEKPFYLLDDLIHYKKPFVYLSPDSPNELEEVSDDNIYIIGGLVDKPVIKNRSLLRFNQINEENGHLIKINSARLPLDKYVDNLRCPALNINTVAEILSYKRDGLSWENAIDKALPNRLIRKPPSK